MIYHMTPWMTGNIGGGVNAAIEPLPEDAWICLRDGDTLFLQPSWGKLVEQIVAMHGDEYAVIGAMTNRIRSVEQLHGGRFSENGDISHHVEIAVDRQAKFGSQVAPIRGVAAGFCMIFSRAQWARHPFVERSIYFDQEFCKTARDTGGAIGIALGLYVFHLYRWGRANPVSYVGHLHQGEAT